MTDHQSQHSLTFLESANAWVVDSGSLQVRYLATTGSADISPRIVDAILSFGPRKIDRDFDFSVVAGTLIAGRRTFPTLSKRRAFSFIEAAIRGSMNLDGLEYHLGAVSPHNHFSEAAFRDRWYSELKLQISGDQQLAADRYELVKEDAFLRTSSIPFDGVVELCQSLGLVDRRGTHSACSLAIEVRPPVDLIFEECSVSDDRLTVSLIAHRKSNKKLISLGVHAFPGKSLSGRKQIASSLSWSDLDNQFKRGITEIALVHANNVLCMLSYGGSTVRRQWLVDPERALNRRTLVLQKFDRELIQLKSGLFESGTDSRRFEKAVSQLAFLLGFASGPSVEKDAPDLLLATPGGILILLECTTRTSDFAAKVGKLVDRVRIAKMSLEDNHLSGRVEAVLVTAQSRSQVAAEESRLADLTVFLVCREDLERALLRLRVPIDPDKLILDAAKRLSAAKQALTPS